MYGVIYVLLLSVIWFVRGRNAVLVDVKSDLQRFEIAYGQAEGVLYEWLSVYGSGGAELEENPMLRPSKRPSIPL